MQTRKAKTFVCAISCIVQETNLVKWSIRSVQYLFRLSFSVRFLSKPTVTYTYYKYIKTSILFLYKF